MLPLAALHTSLYQMGCAAFIGALVQSVALQYPCLVYSRLSKSKLVWLFNFDKVKKSYIVCYACRRVNGRIGKLCKIGKSCKIL